ncbi:hypothetical protein HY493_03160 [Candidatus Woesearchaeota archaeon]|nr:hypothetical protein [Candidatus Woesearchaeota archaeon]
MGSGDTEIIQLEAVIYQAKLTVDRESRKPSLEVTASEPQSLNDITNKFIRTAKKVQRGTWYARHLGTNAVVFLDGHGSFLIRPKEEPTKSYAIDANDADAGQYDVLAAYQTELETGMQISRNSLPYRE